MPYSHEAQLLSRAARAFQPWGPAPNLRKEALLNNARAALAQVTVSRPKVPVQQSTTSLVRIVEVVPAASLPWLRRPSLSPNPCMWMRLATPASDLATALGKMTLDSIPLGAVDELSGLLNRMSVQDVPVSAVDELSDAFAKLSLHDPAIDDLAASFGAMSLEHHSRSLEDLARVFGQCTLIDHTVKSCDAPERCDTPAVSAANTSLPDGVEEEKPALHVTDSFDMKPVSIHSDAYMPLSMADLAANDIFPLGTCADDWRQSAEPVLSIKHGSSGESESLWASLEWGKRQVAELLMRTTVDHASREFAGQLSTSRRGLLSRFIGRLSTRTHTQPTAHLLPLHRFSVLNVNSYVSSSFSSVVSTPSYNRSPSNFATSSILGFLTSSPLGTTSRFINRLYKPFARKRPSTHLLPLYRPSVSTSTSDASSSSTSPSSFTSIFGRSSRDASSVSILGTSTTSSLGSPPAPGLFSRFKLAFWRSS